MGLSNIIEIVLVVAIMAMAIVIMTAFTKTFNDNKVLAGALKQIASGQLPEREAMKIAQEALAEVEKVFKGL